MIAVVTGASSGVGRAIALALKAEGAELVLPGRNVAALGELGGRVIAADFSRGEIPGSEIGAVDVLVHSAGIHALGSESFTEQMQVNAHAPLVLTRALLPGLKARRGQIVFINSSVGWQSKAGWSAYAASKHALRAIANSLREEVNADGVRVLSVFLGRTATPMQEKIYRDAGREYQPERLIQPADVASVVMNALKLPRTAEVTDLFIRPMVKN